nr:MAG TPA: hypothetical protein [Caudoviricetes sp.]
MLFLLGYSLSCAHKLLCNFCSFISLRIKFFLPRTLQTESIIQKLLQYSKVSFVNSGN